MTKYKVRSSSKTVDLDSTNFKTKGGEGSIFIIGDVVYKICEDGKMIPESKFQELAALTNPIIIKPEDVILDSKKKPCGYTMKLVPGNAMPLAKILSKTYRERENILPDMMASLVLKMKNGISYLHSHDGYLQVDGNEYNYMVTDDYKELYFIDVNSFQTPSHPATAIMSSIRDFHCPKDAAGIYLWSKNTDWFGFAVLSFYMFTAIHPFKGNHPSFPSRKTFMVDQMLACKSVFDPEVTFPMGAVYCPFESYIPGGLNGAWMQWYRALFVENKRLEPPKDFQSVLVFAAKLQEIVGSNNFNISEVRDYMDQIVGYYHKHNKEIIVTNNDIYVTNQRDIKPSTRVRVCFTPNQNVPVLAWLDNNKLQLKNLESKQMIPCDIMCKDIMSYDGRLYLQGKANISELIFVENKTTILAGTKSIASIMENATEFYQGVAIQEMFGVKMASIFPESNFHHLIKIEELNDYNIIDAKFENNVLMVIGHNKLSGEYTRFIFRFSKNLSEAKPYDARKVENINPSGLNFTVLDNGICICITEEEKIEIFSSTKDSASVKSIDDPAIASDMRLCHNGLQVKFARGNKLYNFSIRK